VEGLGADPPVILYNGAIVYDFTRDEVWLRVALPRQQALDALRILRRHPAVQPHLYVDDRIFVPRITQATMIYQQKDSLSVEAVGDLADWLTADPTKILIIGERPALQAVARDLDALPYRINHVYSEINFLEILPPGVDKGAALRAVATHLGLEREEIIAAGDNLNDLAMIEYAGLGVAMGNAPEVLRAQADFVAPSNNEHGLQEVIERFILTPV
jgi:hypothetical protein